MVSSLPKFIFLLVFFLKAFKSEPLPDTKPQLTSRTVRTKYGDVSGVIVTLDAKHLEPVEVFRGIPYASPPLGSLRFMPPVTGALWQGVKLADRFSPVCPQRLPDISNETAALRRMPRGRLEYLKRLLPYLKEQSEDCLYLNIYAPAQVAAVFAHPKNAFPSNFPNNEDNKIVLDNNYYDVNRAIIDFVGGKFGITMYYKGYQLMEELKKDCPGFESKLNTKLSELQKCMQEAEKKLATDTICQTAKNYVGICGKPILDLISSCLPPQSKDVVKLAEKAAKAFIQQTCDSSAEKIIEVLNPCQMSKPFTDFPSCQAIKTEIEGFSEKYPTTAFICSLIPKYRKCSKDRQDVSCGNSISNAAFTQYYEAADKATKSICEQVIRN